MLAPLEKIRALSWQRKLALAGLLALLFVVVLPIVTYAYFARDIGDPDRLMNRNNTGIVLLDKNGEAFYRFGRTAQTERLPLDQIADSAEEALIASEDKNFYEHPGVSARGILAAMYANVMNKDLTQYGGSTITQQLVKNTLLTTEKSFLRKYQEMSIAIAVDRRYSKDEILDMYLNSVYFGEGAFGIGPAAEAYFDKKASELTLAESSMLIGLLPAPSAYSPISGDPDKAKRQQSLVLSRMVENGYISEAEKRAAEAAELAYAPAENQEQNNYAQHFAQMVIAELNERYGEERVTRSGYQVTTTLDLNWQKEAERIVAERTAITAASGGSNAALVAIDPKNGEIRALVGSSDWNNQEFGKVNMAIAGRQPGSSFKPIYYTEAMNRKLITPATILEDKPKTFGGSYRPQNYDFRFRGDITVRNALAQSLNIPAVEVMQKLGVNQAVDTAQRMGISYEDEAADRYGLALALGAGEATPLEMTNAFAAFANRGAQYQPVRISSIKNKFGDTIFTHFGKSTQVTSPEAAFLISDILSDNAARAPTFGGSLNIAGRDVAVKTGTTDDNVDAWTIGYTPSLAVGVWVGNNAHEPMGAGGSGYAGPIWRSSMQRFLQDSRSEEFVQPPSVEQVLVCRSNGLRATRAAAGTYSEYFIRGTAPSGSCNVPEPRREEPEQRREEQEEEPEDEQRDTQDGSGTGGNNETPPIEPTDPGDEEGGGGTTEPQPGRGGEPIQPLDGTDRRTAP